MTPRRPRATIGTIRCVGDCPRINYGHADGGDLHLVSLRVASKSEEAQAQDFIRALMPTLSGPRTLSRRRQIVQALIQLARIMGTPLTATEVANLHAWARAVE